MQHIYAIIINFDMNCKLYRMVAVMLYVMQFNLFEKSFTIIIIMIIILIDLN